MARFQFISQNTTWLSPCIKLITVLIVIPSVLTVIHLKTVLLSKDLCFVGPTSAGKDGDLSMIHGIYKARSNSNQYHKTASASNGDLLAGGSLPNALANIILQRQGYPSLFSLEAGIASAEKSSSIGWLPRSDDVLLSFDKTIGSWCFQAAGPNESFCLQAANSDVNANASPSGRIFPPFGKSTIIQSDKNIKRESLHISCPLDRPSYFPTFFGKFWKGLLKKIRSNPNLEFLQIPTTSVLICINVLLAFIYYNDRTDPTLVCKEYQKIVHEGELWRSFTGATAHFDLLHIGFNMMSLYALGLELEPLFGSIPFLFYNVCLIPLTTIVMMSMIYMQIRYTGEERYRYTKSVGYSAVLFAWMVVTSLERESTCPIPFMSGLCFKTYQFDVNSIFMMSSNTKLVLKFNWGPVVQLFVAQVIMPRVSFLGHLAGIVCGFVLHWNLLPREAFYMPQVLIPAILMFHMWYVRKIISFQRRPNGYMWVDNEDSSDVGISSETNRKKTDQARPMIQYLNWAQKGMIGVSLVSIVMFTSLGSEALGQLIATGLLIFSTRRYFMERGRGASDNSSLCALWNATIISVTLLILVDATHMPYWISLSTYIGGKWSVFNISTLAMFMLFRFGMNLVTLVIASNIVTGIAPCRGAFARVFGWVIKCGNAVVTRTSKATGYNAFQGQGVALGSV